MENSSVNDSVETITHISEHHQNVGVCNVSYVIESSFFLEVYGITESALMTTSVILNLIIIVTICASKRLHTVPNVLIASLAVSDFITSFVFGLVEYGVLSRFCSLSFFSLCLRSFAVSFCFVANITNHFVISVERWFYIARPFLHQRIVTRRSTAYSLIIVWGLPAVININMATDNCTPMSLASTFNVGVIIPFLHFLLSLIMIFIDTHITYLTQRAIRNINKTRPMGMSNEAQGGNRALTSLRSAWKNIRMLITMFGGYFILMTPGICADMYAYSTDHNFYRTTNGKIVDIVWSTHCCLNFFIYAVQDRTFRNVLKEGVSRIHGCVFNNLVRKVHAVADSM